MAQQSSASSLQANSKAVQAELERKSAEDVEKACGELSAQHKKEVEQLQATIARLEGSQGDKDREADDLKAQVDKCSSLEGQLMALNQQLQQEMGSKKVRAVAMVAMTCAAMTCMVLFHPKLTCSTNLSSDRLQDGWLDFCFQCVGLKVPHQGVLRERHL